MSTQNRLFAGCNQQGIHMFLCMHTLMLPWGSDDFVTRLFILAIKENRTFLEPLSQNSENELARLLVSNTKPPETKRKLFLSRVYLRVF